MTFIFSSSDEPLVTLLAAGIVWSAPQGNAVSITEIGAYRKKLSSPFRRLVGVSAHQETDILPIPKDRLQDIIEEIGSYAKQPGNHILFFGYETISTDLLINISRFLHQTPVHYQIMVCQNNDAQLSDLMEIQTIFEGLSHKSWIYAGGADESELVPHRPFWQTCKAPRLDDAILKKVMDGEFRVFETLRMTKTNLSILQSMAFEKWLAEFGACTTNN